MIGFGIGDARDEGVTAQLRGRLAVAVQLTGRARGEGGRRP